VGSNYVNQVLFLKLDEGVHDNLIHCSSWAQWLMSITLATWEAEITRIKVQSQLG
jgi:hypothetical protein